MEKDCSAAAEGVISVLSLIITVEDLNNILISQYVEHVITMEGGRSKGGKAERLSASAFFTLSSTSQTLWIYKV